jgi:hypothetical protein
MALLRSLPRILAAIRDLSTNGFISRTSATTVAARSIVGTADQITVADGDGVAGPPTLSTPQDIDTAAAVQFGSLGLGVAPAHPIHVRAGDSGATPVGAADDFFFEGSGAAGMTVAAPDGSSTAYALGDATTPGAVRMIWTSTSSYMELGTYKSGASVRLRSGGGSLALTIHDDQRISIGTTNSSATLRVKQAVSDANIPVLYLEQDDISEPFATLRGSAESGELARSIVAAGDVGSATVAGYVMVAVIDDGNVITDQDYFLPLYTLA